MKKEDKKELVMMLKEITEALGSAVDNQKEFTNALKKVIVAIEFLFKNISLISFILSLLVWRVFLWEPIDILLGVFVGRWILLSEKYQIIILGFIGTILATIIANIASYIFLEKIKSILKKK